MSAFTSTLAQVQIEDIICYDVVGDEEAKRAMPLSDGGWLLSGDIETEKWGVQIVVTRLDADLNYVWSQSFGGSGYEFSQDLLEWQDGTFWVAGYTTSYGAGRRDYYLLHLSASGDLIKDVTIGTAGDDAATIVEKIDETTLLIGGVSYGEAGRDPDNYFVHVDTSGKVTREMTFGGRGAEALWASTPLRDGSGWLMVGQTTSTFNGEKDVYVVQTDRNGDIVWSRQFGGAGDDRAFAVTAMDEDWVISGFSTSQSPGIRNGYILAIDADGELLWETYVPNAQTLEFHGVQAAGGRVMAGGFIFNPQYGDDVFVAELDRHGQILSTFDLEGSLTQKGRDLFIHQDKVFLFGNKFGLYDDDLGFFIYSWSALASAETYHLIPDIFPNPVQDILTIDTQERFTWSLFGMQGTFLGAGNGPYIDVSDLVPGPYCLKMVHSSGHHTIRIVKTGR